MVKKMTSKYDCERNEEPGEGELNNQEDNCSLKDDLPTPRQRGRRSRRQISKPKRGKKDSKNLKKTKKTKKIVSEEQEDNVFFCEKHPGNRVEFICTSPKNIKELCSHCLLDYKNYINDIHLISDVVEQYKAKLVREDIPQIQNKITETQGNSLSKLEDTCTMIREKVNKVINCFRQNLIYDDQKLADGFNNVRDFKTHFVDNADVIAHSLKNNNLDRHSLLVLKKFMQDKPVERCNKFTIETNLLLEQVERALENNITYVQDTCNVNSTDEGFGKFMHWFEWEKRNLHLFDVTRYSLKTIKLIIPFNIYPFSRSIITSDGIIYLLGGEDKIEGAKKEVYTFNIANMDRDQKLYNKPSMLYKKYDFTLCFLDGCIYVICGKNADNEIVASCERYTIATETWEMRSNANIRRYAASAATIKEKKKIFLFGGRGEAQNLMIKEIEEYCVETNIWKVLKINETNNWKAVEVCAAVQLRKNEIIIFGGSDVNVEDSSDTYIFKAREGELVKAADLIKPHVFVSAPFVYGNYVFAIGNEYYVKSRNIHRFDIKRNKWEIIF